MQTNYPVGRILAGDAESISRSRALFEAQEIDDIRIVDDEGDGFCDRRTSIAAPVSATAPGTFIRRAQRTLNFSPGGRPGWWIKRTDLPEQLPILVSARNVWTAQRNIVLRSGSPHNYLRMVEHIIALRMGCGIDDMLVETDSGDPPLFDRSSLDMVEALTAAGVRESDTPATYVTVKEPVTVAGDRGDFVTLLPAERWHRKLRMDCAIDFASAIGKQRVIFDVTRETFRHGAAARTNATRQQLIMTRTIGQFLPETRNLGYTCENILIHGRKRYVNRPLLIHNGRSLEAVWHRATLDLLAALALIDTGRFIGTAVSYRAGHLLDTRLMTLLYLHDLLEDVK